MIITSQPVWRPGQQNPLRGKGEFYSGGSEIKLKNHAGNNLSELGAHRADREKDESELVLCFPAEGGQAEGRLSEENLSDLWR